MGNFITSEYNTNLKSNLDTAYFTIDRQLNNQIRIGIHPKGKNGIKYFPNPDEDECYHSYLKASNIDNNKATFYYEDDSVLEIIKKDGKHTFTYNRNNQNVISDEFVLPYKTIGLQSEYDVIAKLQ